MEESHVISDPIYDLSDAESKFDSNQKLISFGAVLGSIGLAVQNLMDEMGGGGWPKVAIVLTALSGWIVFGTGVLRNRGLGPTEAGKAFFEQARQDERLVNFRLQAFTFGFGAMLVLQVILMLLAVGGGVAVGTVLSIPVAASATIATGVSAPVLRYQNLSNQ